KVTLVSAGRLTPAVPSLYIAPPAVAAELPLKVTLVSTGLLAPRLPSLYIAPPLSAELPLKVMLLRAGLHSLPLPDPLQKRPPPLPLLACPAVTVKPATTVVPVMGVLVPSRESTW